MKAGPTGKSQVNSNNNNNLFDMFFQKQEPEYSIMQEILMENKIVARPTLRYGNAGNNVRYLQVRLNYHLASIIPLKEDGIWGKKTHAAVLNFQRAKKLVVDGVVGPITWSVLEQPAQPLIMPQSCKIPGRRPPIQAAVKSFSQSTPLVSSLPTLPKPRTCCMLGPAPFPFSPNFGNPNNLGIHRANEAVTLIYAGKAGFVDLAHLRDMCDLVQFVYEQLKKGLGYTSPIITYEGEVILKKCPADLLATARAISYDDSVAHEIRTYWDMEPGGHNSSFSPEDLCSNNLGTIIAERAILSIERDPLKKFDTEVTNILNQIIQDLDGQSSTESEAAFKNINMKWIKFNFSIPKASNYGFDDYLQRRNFDLLPWKAGHKSDSNSPAWILNRPKSDYSIYTYKCTMALRTKMRKTFTNAEFGRETSLIKSDAEKRYGKDFDKP